MPRHPRNRLGDVVLETDPSYRPFLSECPRIWIAVTSKVVKIQYGKPIPKGMPMPGFEGLSKQEVQQQIDDAVWNADWPPGALRPKRVLDCHLRSRRVITPVSGVRR